MKDRGKAVEVFGDNEFSQDYSFSSDLPCRKHPQSSSVGICPICLKDRLVKLVCSDCGEQRLSSCSCSEISSNPRTSCAGEVGSVGRVSFLIENENKDPMIPARPKKIGEKLAEEVFLLKRSNSSCVEIKRKNGFWKIGRLFRRKDRKDCGRSVAAADARSDNLWVVDYAAGGVSRSRSLCSFRGNGNGFFGSEDGGDLMNYSGARSSISAARSSSVNGGLLFDPERKSGFSEAEPRKSGFDSDRRDSTDIGPGGNRKVFSLKESFFSGGEDSGFIDLKFDSESKVEMNIASFKKGVVSDSKSTFGSMRVGDVVPPESGEGIVAGDEIFYNSGSCRGMVSDRGIKKGRKSFKGWKWIFKNHQTWASNPRKRDEQDIRNVNP